MDTSIRSIASTKVIERSRCTILCWELTSVGSKDLYRCCSTLPARDCFFRCIYLSSFWFVHPSELFFSHGWRRVWYRLQSTKTEAYRSRYGLLTCRHVRHGLDMVRFLKRDFPVQLTRRGFYSQVRFSSGWIHGGKLHIEWHAVGSGVRIRHAGARIEIGNIDVARMVSEQHRPRERDDHQHSHLGIMASYCSTDNI